MTKLLVVIGLMGASLLAQDTPSGVAVAVQCSLPGQIWQFAAPATRAGCSFQIADPAGTAKEYVITLHVDAAKPGEQTVEQTVPSWGMLTWVLLPAVVTPQSTIAYTVKVVTSTVSGSVAEFPIISR